MNHRDDRKPLPPDIEDDVEILEVVGFDEDDAPVAEAPDAETDGDGADDGEYEIDVVFDEDAMASPVEADDAGLREDDGARERYLRLQAEFENLKKRVEREKEDFYVHATASLVERLLPVLDNFDRAILHATEDPATGGGAFLDGVRLIHKQLLDELNRQGLRPVVALGEPFDPEHHEAVATEPRDDRPPGTVLMEFQRGYYFRDRLLRPALVQVSVDGGGNDGSGGGEDTPPTDVDSHGNGDGAEEA